MLQLLLTALSNNFLPLVTQLGGFFEKVFLVFFFLKEGEAKQVAKDDAKNLQDSKDAQKVNNSITNASDDALRNSLRKPK